MQKINVIGERAIYWFKDANGNLVSEFSTDTDYNDRFIYRTKGTPTKEGYTYVKGKRATLFDTPDGFIHENQYALCFDTFYKEERVLLKLADDKFLNLSKDDVKLIQTKTTKADTYKGELNKSDIDSLKEITSEDLK